MLSADLPENRNGHPERDIPENRNAEPQAEQLAQRRALCDACEHKLPIGLCSQCGCVIFLKTKWKSQSCPLGKWGSAER
jgi:hypothetical protein